MDPQLIKRCQGNLVLKDVVKFLMAIEGDTCVNGFYSADYLKEKLQRIIHGDVVWHAKIEEVFEEWTNQIASAGKQIHWNTGCVKKKLMNS